MKEGSKFSCSLRCLEFFLILSLWNNFKALEGKLEKVSNASKWSEHHSFMRFTFSLLCCIKTNKSCSQLFDMNKNNSINIETLLKVCL